MRSPSPPLKTLFVFPSPFTKHLRCLNPFWIYFRCHECGSYEQNKSRAPCRFSLRRLVFLSRQSATFRVCSGLRSRRTHAPSTASARVSTRAPSVASAGARCYPPPALLRCLRLPDPSGCHRSAAPLSCPRPPLRRCAAVA